jgi:hypothetical protein
MENMIKDIFENKFIYMRNYFLFKFLQRNFMEPI